MVDYTVPSSWWLLRWTRQPTRPSKWPIQSCEDRIQAAHFRSGTAQRIYRSSSYRAATAAQGVRPLAVTTNDSGSTVHIIRSL
ncbi:hypothetical protein BS17DRAFT_774343 [Gyrodon lividus]|nr:hypothetical protein BS17DRAFT_774343 [Gyrodon lividus]